MALNGLLCADVPLRNYSLTHSLTHSRSVLFGVVVHAGCDKQDLLIRGGSRGKRASTLYPINYPTVDRRNCWSHSTSHQSESHICMSRIAILPTPRAFDALVGGGVPVGIFPQRLVLKNYNDVATRWWKYFAVMFNHFYRIHERDRQTDGQTPHHGI